MDTPYRERSRSRPGFQYRAPAVITISAVSFVLSMLGGTGNALDGLVLSADKTGLEGFLASCLFHPNRLHLLVNLFLLAAVSGTLETRWGTPRFVAFFLFSAWGTNLVTIVTARLLDESGPACGASGVAVASLVAVGLVYPSHRLFRTVPILKHLPQLKHLVWIAVFLGGAALAFLPEMPGKGRYFLLPQLSGAAFALLFAWLDPFCLRLARGWRIRRDEERRREVVRIRHRVDDLLEKISTSGYNSLTRDEEQFLRQASKYFRQD